MRLSTAVGSAILILLACVPASGDEAEPEAFRERDLTLRLAIDYPNQRLSGSATCDIENWTTRPARQVSLLLNRLMEASGVRDAAGRSLPYTQDVVCFRDLPLRQVTQLTVRLPRPVAPGDRTTLRVDYGGHLVGYTEIGWLYVRDHIDTAFTILRAEALAFPVVGGLWDEANRRVPRTDFTYDVAVRVPARYRVATGGALTRAAHEDGTITWRYASGRPSPFLDVAIAPFDTASAGGVRVFYFPADSAGGHRLLERAQAALRMLTQWFGPLHENLNLTLTEIPDGWGSQASPVGGIIQTAAAFRDPRRVSELYHELSHLWNAPDLESPSPRWNEGLATFLEVLMRERLDGWSGRARADSTLLASARLSAASDSALRTVPFADYGRRGMTDHAYVIGFLMFATLYQLVGEQAFDRVIGGYYQDFPKGGTARDLAAFATRTTARDLRAFFDDWMFTARWSAILTDATSVRDLADHYRAAGR